LKRQGISDEFFEQVAEDGEALAKEIREATFALADPPRDHIFENVYTDPHPVIDAQRKWLSDYENSLEDADE
jgi:Pyruvate/2-oxoglutarate dehydrogenase complex, dehydrogenase (E1) component, eukaryotic type, alpha subunit